MHEKVTGCLARYSPPRFPYGHQSNYCSVLKIQVMVASILSMEEESKCCTNEARSDNLQRAGREGSSSSASMVRGSRDGVTSAAALKHIKFNYIVIFTTASSLQSRIVAELSQLFYLTQIGMKWSAAI
ncbi:hypothetical protein CEXT_302671 [Caerostris extrusa]|uniref:Uncharacterized protein n=1 Tax=Caerostris extrusa TaxID=172846 RepID=A0AAV4VF36_CAEEX|nr:hypothetical protein CEXT_302671 [Caerostris extrusa]